MKNKKIITLIIIFKITNSFLLYPQDQDNHNEIIDIKTFGTDLNVIEKNSMFSIFPYKLTDGKKLSYNDTLRIVKSLEINEILLKEEKKYRITSNVVSFIGGIGLLGWLLFLDNDQRDNSTLYMLPATAVFSVTTIVTKSIAEKKLSEAVLNYNLYVMGIQIQNN
jgi:hypothetical protein